ncbi:hypothetical protein P6P90_00840 [Ectobacillus antri]|uniref:Uncharacterized protein n=1 Tax=Ectobacillus antri TaxID=2486280 RepID=A0ABT6H265_9BACI|nr:hypothetical protein [Ectobacillus antri]MDG4655871.1 hypothetical protein [Ectobacillus antri]MDG5752546.1 hypothetical protein [Ectobacillus antri]
MATTQQVADFYDVPYGTIYNAYREHTDELNMDGVQCVTAKGFKDLVKVKNTSTKIINQRGYFLVETEAGFVKMANRSNGLFPKRAILRDSEVAK